MYIFAILLINKYLNKMEKLNTWVEKVKQIYRKLCKTRPFFIWKNNYTLYLIFSMFGKKLFLYFSSISASNSGFTVFSAEDSKQRGFCLNVNGCKQKIIKVAKCFCILASWWFWKKVVRVLDSLMSNSTCQKNSTRSIP